MTTLSDRTFVIVPSYNEGRVLRPTLEALLERGYEVVVVDDGSSDDTRQRVSDLPVHYVRHLINLGQGAALQTGMQYALSQSAEEIVHFDGDGQHPIDQIPELLAPLREGKADVVLGSRFLMEQHRAEVPRLKQLLLKAGIWVNYMATGVKLTDAHNGFRALTGSAASAINLQQAGFAHATEILEQIRRANLRWTEIPTRIVYTEYSMQKGQSMLNSINIVLDLILRKLIR